MAFSDRRAGGPFDPARRWVLALLGCGGGLAIDPAFVRPARLADGSRLWRAPGTDADVDIDRPLRRIVLHAGALCLTASGGRRPFVIDLPHGRVHAAAACCLVRVDGAASAVRVLAGRIDIAPTAGRTFTLPCLGRAHFGAEGVRL